MSAHPKFALLCSSGEVRMDRDWKPWIQTYKHLVLGKRLIGSIYHAPVSTQHMYFGKMLWFEFLGPFIHLDNLLFEFSHPADVLSIESTVHIEKTPILNRQFQLPSLLAATIQENVTALETNL